MVYDYFDKYTFLCEMYDEQNDECIMLVLHFFPYDNSIQLINTSKEKVLLKRVQLPTLKLEMLQIGNVVNVYSKLIVIRDAAPATQRTLLKNNERTFALIKPMPSKFHGKIITYILQKGFRIVQLKNAKISKEFAMMLYAELAGSSVAPHIIEYVTSGEVIGLELEGPNAVSMWRKCLGATDPKDAEPGTIRNIFGGDIIRNVAHGCNTLENAKKMIPQFFGYEKGTAIVPYLSSCKDCTCCIVKPHTLMDGSLGDILERINASGIFTISAMAMFDMRIGNALEFFEIYKGVLDKYEMMSLHLAEGKCLALEIKSIDPKINVVCQFRKFCGPRDPDLCRQLYPDTLRALYGRDLIHNAVHCTDLPEDGELEVEYFFKLLANQS